MKNTLLTIAAMLICPLAGAQDKAESITVQEWSPKSMYNIPISQLKQPAYEIVDMHSHNYAQSAEELDSWVQVMDKMGIKKTIVHTGATGPVFDSISAAYSRHSDRFDMWCGLDLSDWGKPTFSQKAVAELKRCHAIGAKGVGEITDKGLGVYSSTYSKSGAQFDDETLIPIFQTCANLGMAINVHVAEPIWMYLPLDKYNEGLPNAANWAIDLSVPGILDHAALIKSFQKCLEQNPRTTFIACHWINCSYDLTIPASMLDRFPNLYIDNSARFGETAAIPRTMHKFYARYADRIVYGTDNGMGEDMYATIYRFMETEDENFYSTFGYRRPCSGYKLPKSVLKKVYQTNERSINKRLTKYKEK